MMSEALERIIAALTAINKKEITDTKDISEILMLCHIDLENELDIACKNANIKKDALEFKTRSLMAVNTIQNKKNKN